MSNFSIGQLASPAGVATRVDAFPGHGRAEACAILNALKVEPAA